MSGYCPDCGNTLCICKELEALEQPVSEEKKKTWMVTLPYDDVRGMEARSELLEEIKNDLQVLKPTIDNHVALRGLLDAMLYKINQRREK